MQLASIAPAPATAPAAPRSDRNPWGFPKLDPAVARRASAGLDEGVKVLNRMIDRSFAVRVLLDRDLKSGVFAPDTVRAVELLHRAARYASRTVSERTFPRDLQVAVVDWVRANPKDQRIGVVTSTISNIEQTLDQVMDDDEGNVREEIAAMRTDPSRRLWQSIRDGVDGGIATLYEARDVSSAKHVLRAAGELS